MPDDHSWTIPLDGVLRFGAYQIDVPARELFVRGQAVHVEPKAFDLLLYLISNRDRVVSKGELLDVLWPRLCVSECSLSQLILKVRRAIGDSRCDPLGARQWIRTVQRVGYRFVGDIVGSRRLSREPAQRESAAVAVDCDQAHRTYRRALQAAQLGQTHLALALCLECGFLDPGSLDVQLELANGAVPASGDARLYLRWRGPNPSAHPGSPHTGTIDERVRESGLGNPRGGSGE